MFFLVAYLSAIIYFMSLVYPERDCPGTLDTPIAVNAEGDQIHMKSQACGFIPRVKTVSLYVRGTGGGKYGPFLVYMPDSAVPHVVWTTQHGIAVDLASARNILQIGTLDRFAVDYDIGQVRP